MQKELLFSVTQKDFRVEYTNGTGAGGQYRNKHAQACRITHPASGASAFCQEERSQKTNRERAFDRLVKSDKFQQWLKIETAKQMGKLVDIDAKVEQELTRVRVDVKDDQGNWVDENLHPEFKEEASNAI